MPWTSEDLAFSGYTLPLNTLLYRAEGISAPALELRREVARVVRDEYVPLVSTIVYNGAVLVASACTEACQQGVPPTDLHGPTDEGFWLRVFGIVRGQPAADGAESSLTARCRSAARRTEFFRVPAIPSHLSLTR